MMKPPFLYNEIDVENSRFSPSTVHAKNTYLVNYYKKYLFQRALSVFEFSNLPKTWDKNYFLYGLFGLGYMCVFNTDSFGVIPQCCTLGGYNVFYRPSFACVANPLIKGAQKLSIGKYCEIIHIQPDYGSIMDIVSYYADLMALCSETAGINLINSKVSMIFRGETKAEIETYKKLYDSVQAGNPAAFLGKKLGDGEPVEWMPFVQNVGQNYIVDRILEDMRKIEIMFDTECGIPNANTNKKERLTTDEVNVNNSETTSKIILWLSCLQDSLKKVNNMFDLNISADIREEFKGGVPCGGSVNSRSLES